MLTVMNAILVLAIMLLPTTSSWANSITVFDNDVPNSDGAGFGFSPSDFAVMNDTPFGQSGDDFTNSTPVTISEIEWWGVYFPGNSPLLIDDFTVRIFEFNGMSPEIEPIISLNVGNVQRVNTGLGGSNSTIFNYRLNMLDVSLSSGSFLLSIVNNSPMDPVSPCLGAACPVWRWSTSKDLSGTAWVRPEDSVLWTPASNSLAFNLGGTPVPEPSTILLLGTGLVGIAFRRWRKSKTK